MDDDEPMHLPHQREDSTISVTANWNLTLSVRDHVAQCGYYGPAEETSNGARNIQKNAGTYWKYSENIFGIDFDYISSLSLIYKAITCMHDILHFVWDEYYCLGKLFGNTMHLWKYAVLCYEGNPMVDHTVTLEVSIINLSCLFYDRK